MKHSPRTSSDTSAQRKARVAAVIVNAKAERKKIPRGIKLIGFREPTAAERDFAKTLLPPPTRKRSKAAA